MKTQLRFLGGFVIPVALVVACGSSSKSGSTTDAGSGGQSGTGGGANAGGQTGTGGGDAGATCDKTSCEGYTGYTACCSGTGCGVTSSALANQCVPISLINQFKDAGNLFGSAELIVPDPKCKAATNNGITVAGCCDKTGFCGGSTASIPSNPFIQIPVECLTPGDEAKLASGIFGAQDAGPETPCDYAADLAKMGKDGGSSADAGKSK